MSNYPYCPNPDPSTGLCVTCGRPCEERRNGWQHTRRRCGAWMRNAREHCWRLEGHRDSHRTRYAMECDNENRRAA